MESISTNNDVRKMIDTLVAGYLGRQKYWESLKCLMNESSIFHAAQCGGMSIVLGDTVHGKHLEEIIILFSEYGNFGLNPGLLDFGVRLRSLANEFTSLTNACAHWSDAQKLLYGKHSTPSRSQQNLSVTANELNICESNQNMLLATNVDSTTSISSQHSNGSASTRRKCAQPVSINTRRREFMKEVVEPVVHTAQQIIDNGSGNITDPNSSLSALSMITIDENAVGTLDRCMAHENFAELIESIEKDFPDGFFDSFPNSDNTESLHEAVFNVSSQSNDTQQEHEPRDDDSQNLYNIPHSVAIEESKPLCSSTPTKLKTQENSSVVPGTSSSKASSTLKTEFRRLQLQPKAMRKKPVIAESAIFRDRVEVECPYLPIEETEREVDSVGRGFFISSKNMTKSSDDSFGKTKTGKLEISAGWRKLAELCDESNKKAVENEERKEALKRDSLEICQSTNQKLKDKETKHPLSSSAELELRAKVRNEINIPLSTNSNAVTSHQMDKCVEDKGTVQNTKFTSKSLIEREIDLLFENSDDQDCKNLRTQKVDEWKFLDSTHATSSRENRKGLEDRNEISGDEDLTVGYRERHTSVKFITDKKKRKHQKQKLVGNDFTSDSKISPDKKRQLEEMYVSSSVKDNDRQSDSTLAGSNSLCKLSEQCKKQEKFRKLEEDREEARASAEKRKKEKEFLMKKEREEIERQKREVEEKELKRAAERERKRREEEEREVREKEQREKRRKEREDREKLKKMKGKDDKLSNSCNSKRQQERSKDRKSKKELRSILQFDSKNDEVNEASILDKLFGDDDSLKVMTKISDKEEMKRKCEESRTRSSSTQKIAGKMKFTKEDYRMKREKSERCTDLKATKNTKESGSNRPDTLDDLFNCLAAKPGTSRKDETDVLESKLQKKVVSGVNKGRENLLVGGGHSARVGMVLEKATRIRTKYEHEEKLKQEYRKVESIRRVSASTLEHSTRKRILDLPIPKTPDLLSQLLKPDLSPHNDSLGRSVSAKNISSCSEADTLIAASSKISVSSKSTTSVCSPLSGSGESKSLYYSESSGISSPNVQVKKPRLDMAAIDAVLQSLHGLDKASSSSTLFSTTPTSGSEPALT
uniref:Bm7940 n=1 Tax=Brugia malayi TaxID=6279 RepID=A0A0H5S111_BRUMA|nr:Bm7940 [Brugia malayi]